MADKGTPYKLQLDEDVRADLEMFLCNRVDDAVQGASERNSQLRIWRDQLEGFGVTAQTDGWANACNLCDPISLMAFLTILSQLLGAMHRDPMVAVEAFREEDVENARILEAWLSMAGAQNDVLGRIYDLAHNGCIDPAVVGYVGWHQETRVKREVGYKAPGSSLLVPEDAQEEGVEYEEGPMAEEVTEERYDIRAVDLNDFFLWPPTVKSVNDATLVAERMYLTEEQLFDGIEDFGYEREAVETAVTYGPKGAQGDGSQQADADIDGLRLEGLYEVFVAYTRLPHRLNGEFGRIPKHLLQDDFLCVCCPDADVILKLAFSPFAERPYFIGNILPKPHKVQGYGLMGMLDGLQAEANANLQLSIDASNLTVAPMVVTTEQNKESMAKQLTGPGAIISVTDPHAILPWPINTNPTRDGLAWQEFIQGRYQSVVSAEGQGQLQNKVRKNGEIQAVEQASSAKFGMYLSNFQRTVVTEVFRRMIGLKARFGGVEEDGEEFADANGKTKTLTPQALAGRYNIVATGTSLTHSPEARVEVGKEKQAIQVQYLQAKAQLPPDSLPLLWHGARELLYDLGERNPEAWIGEEPQIPEPQQPAPGQVPAPPAPVGLGLGATQLGVNN